MTAMTTGNTERLLTPGEVAALFRVDPKTVTRWASADALPDRTPGGHRRFRESEVREMLADLTSEATVSRAHRTRPRFGADLYPGAGLAGLPSTSGGGRGCCCSSSRSSAPQSSQWCCGKRR